MIHRHHPTASRRLRRPVRESFSRSSARHVDNDGFNAHDFLYDVGNVMAENLADMVNDDEEFGNPAESFDTEVQYLSHLGHHPEKTAEKLFKRLVKDGRFGDLVKDFIERELDDLLDWAEEKI